MTFLLADSGDGGSLIEWIESFGGSAWVLALVLVFATLASEDLTCIAGGILAANGVIPFAGASCACALGIWLGDLGLYGLGVLADRSRRNWRWLNRLARPSVILRGRQVFERHGVKWIFLSRFLPGTRVPSYVAAGAVRWSFRKFALALALASLVWTPILCGASFFAGHVVLGWLESYQRWAWPILIGTAVLLWVLLRLVLPLFSWRGRRLLHIRLARLRRWEFWPVWVVYPPVVLWLAWQALRRRSPFLFTCCNPAIPHGGFAMESKGDILDLLHCPDESRIRIARYRRLKACEEGENRAGEVAAFLSEEGLDYPVVLKPDIGERGQGVAVIRTAAEAAYWLAACREAAIVQEYIEGPEFGVQWGRGPEEKCGEVPSLGGKHAQCLKGDGESTLEELILKHPRASMMAGYFLAKFAARLEEVPAGGTRVDLTEIGTHARGAVFTDERQHITGELREVLDGIGDHSPGISFGRYDLRVPSLADLQAGRGLVILEFNGVTGEPIHVYQPGYPWRKGVRDLCRHWSLACEIGAAHRRMGVEPGSLHELWRLVRAHRKRAWFEADDLCREDGDE
ncbi:MAG: VTT domain-containing protein [Roseibacillus sp.]|nr:VTT domain-containing protein [Roseibacillus sp.]